MHLRQTLYKGKNHVCLGGTTENVTLITSPTIWYPSQAALWAYSCTGGGTPQGHTQFLHPHNL